MELRNVIANNIVALRTEAGMTQAALAEVLSYSDKAVSKWERADSIPDVFMLKRIADYFGTTIDDLVN
jgi:transcriptional regulator with XRE-family HTH domain